MPQKKINPDKKKYVFTGNAHFEFVSRKDTMDGMNCSSTKIARGIKNGKIFINNVEYKFERKYFLGFFEKIKLFHGIK